MSIQVNWYDGAHTFIYWQFEDGWTVDDLHAALVRNRELLDSVHERVDLILDISAGGLAPPDVVRFIRYHRIDPHPLSHMKIIVGANQYLQLFWRNVAPFAPRNWNIQFAGSIEEAQAMVAQDRSQVLMPA